MIATRGDWLDSSGRFRFGKYGPTGKDPGELIEYVAKVDPGYLEWVLESIENLPDDDREIMEAHLARRRKR